MGSSRLLRYLPSYRGRGGVRQNCCQSLSAHSLIASSPPTVEARHESEDPAEEEVDVAEQVERRGQRQSVGEVHHQNVALELPDVVRLRLQPRSSGRKEGVKQSHEDEFEEYEVLESEGVGPEPGGGTVQLGHGVGAGSVGRGVAVVVVAFGREVADRSEEVLAVGVGCECVAFSSD